MSFENRTYFLSNDFSNVKSITLDKFFTQPFLIFKKPKTIKNVISSPLTMLKNNVPTNIHSKVNTFLSLNRISRFSNG